MQLSLRFCLYVLLVVFSYATGHAQRAELAVQTGHVDFVISVAFSPDGKTLASSGWDHTVKLWDVTSGTELRTLKGHSGSVESVAFSPDGKTLASGSGDNTIKLWDVTSGTELRTLKGHSSSVESVAFSPDGKTLASGSYDFTIKLWNVTSGTELRTLKGHSGPVTEVAFSPDGKTLAGGSEDKTIKLWDVNSGTELRTLKGHSELVNSVAFSPDGKTLASSSGNNTIKLWDVTSGTELRTLKGHSSWFTSVAFSTDGKTLASSTYDKTIELWDVASGTELRTLKGHSGPVFSLAFNPDGMTLASGSGDKTIKLWDLTSGTELRTLKGHSRSVDSVAFSPDGKTLASGDDDKTIRLWDLTSGTELRTLKGHSQSVDSVAFSPDGKTLASGSWDETIKLWDVTSGAELRTLKGHSKRVVSVAFSPDGKTLASGSWDDTIKLWDVTSGTELLTLNEQPRAVYSVAFSPDGKTLASGSFNMTLASRFSGSPDNTIKLWDVTSGTELRTLSGHSDHVISVAFSPDGKTLASGSWDNTIKLWDVSSGTELRTLKGHSDPVTSLAFSPDRKTLASGSRDMTIKVWDVISGTELHTFKGHSNWIAEVAFSPDGKTLASGSSDSYITLWRVADGKELTSLMALDEQDWLVITPDGLFDGSPAAWNTILWRFDNNTFSHAPVEVFFKEYWRPGLLQDIYAGKQPESPRKDIAAIDIRQPQVKITSVGGQAIIEQAVGERVKLANTVNNRSVEISMEVVDNPKAPPRSDQASSGAKDLRLFRNGSLVKLWPGDIFEKQSGCEPVATKPNEPRRAICKAIVSVVTGVNNFTAYAFNHEDVKSTDAKLEVTGVASLKRVGVLYVVAVGVNTYENKAFDLKYAVPDAEDFSTELKHQQDKLKSYERTEIISLNNDQATKQKIVDVLKNLAGRAQPEDAIVMYFAGHGTVGSCLSQANRQVNAKDRFYLVPHDLGYKGEIPEKCEQLLLDEVAKHSVSDLELESLFEKIDAGQLLLVIDACNSGQALESEEKRRGPMNSKGLAQLAYEKGMYILTAAQSLQEAKADKTIAKGHGYLTYALIEEALKEKKAANGEGNVLLRAWVDYAVQRVPRMQQAAAERRQFVKKQGERPVPAGDEEIQTPRVFYRREVDVKPFVVAKP